MTTENPQRPCALFQKLRSEVRPPLMMRRDQRLRLMPCSFEEIAESEEEDIQLPERTSTEGRSPYALTLPSLFAEKRPASPQSPVCARKFAPPRLCRGFHDPMAPRRCSSNFMFSSPSPDRPDTDFFTLPPILEGVTTSS
ncbi:hypothetical protein OESDEN_03821 [Oesophagostomum dentatum]|uniref:Uncharacterized protein n=1 Tax=Oesophagostomum dentatum TaxID=61180 RepID=A0A0B1TG63_OESDE|nr:hypothetical protein OESDEN_03821 [Oesophagostomum dentatum]